MNQQVFMLREPTHPGRWLVIPVSTTQLFRTGMDCDSEALPAYVTDVRRGDFGLEYTCECGVVRMAEKRFGQMHHWIEISALAEVTG